MFDNTPSTDSSGAVAGTNMSVLNTGERKALHYIENIYDPDKHPPEDLTKYTVPQENELIFDVENGLIHRAAHVDYQGGTLKTTMVPWRLQNIDEGTTTEQDWIFGVRGGPMLGEALLSVDFSVRPNVARVDSTIMRPGAAYALLYRGNNIGDAAGIISAQYDASANMVKNEVPCQLAEIVDRTNLMIMTTGPFSVTDNAEGLPDGSRATLVFFDQGGNFIPPAQPVMVQHSAYMRDHRIGVRYVTSVELISPWFSKTSDPNRMIVPINMNLLAIEFRAVVHYSDGQSEPLAVNSSKWKLHGLREYRPKWPGQTGEVTLTYELSADEQLYIADPGSPNHKSQTYVIEAGNVQGAYSPKIYTYPQWDPAIIGYRLQHFLYDIDRRTWIDVTDKVTLNDQSVIYRPNSYGVAQTLIFNLNLRDVAPTYESVVFIQYTEIVLLKDINGPGSRWSVSYVSNKPTYVAKPVVVKNNGAFTTFKIQAGFERFEEWIAGMYDSVYPSFDSWNEDKPPAPTHFDFMHEDGRRWRFPVSAWDKDNAINISLQKGKTWYINWINRDASGIELQLASTGVTVELFVP